MFIALAIVVALVMSVYVGCNSKEPVNTSVIELTSVNEQGETIVETSVVVVNEDGSAEPVATGSDDKAGTQSTSGSTIATSASDNSSGNTNTNTDETDHTNGTAAESDPAKENRPTDSAKPTNTPKPTATNKPTATATPKPTNGTTPTNTPKPTNSPVPTATNTPVPTSTPTPEPTATPAPEPTEAPKETDPEVGYAIIKVEAHISVYVDDESTETYEVTKYYEIEGYTYNYHSTTPSDYHFDGTIIDDKIWNEFGENLQGWSDCVVEVVRFTN